MFVFNFETLNFTTGAVSALVGPEKNITQFQLTAPIQPGNSGGPILNTWGSLVGVTFARIDDVSVLEQSGTIPQNINYGIKHDVVRDMLEEYNNFLDLRSPIPPYTPGPGPGLRRHRCGTSRADVVRTACRRSWWMFVRRTRPSVVR